MPRDPRKVEKRITKPDLKYNNLLVAKLIQKTMFNGKKSLATSLVYNTFDIIAEKTEKDPLEVFLQAFKNVCPILEVKSRRIGGANYQVPMEVKGNRKTHLTLIWILKAVKSRKGKSFSEILAEELIAASQNQGAAIKKKEDTHKMAEANRAFAHFARY